METLKGMFHWKSNSHKQHCSYGTESSASLQNHLLAIVYIYLMQMLNFCFRKFVSHASCLLIFIFIITVLPDLRVWPFSTQEWPAPNFSSQQHPWINLLNLNHIYWNNDNLWLFTCEAYVIYRCKNAERWDWTVYRPVGIDGRNFYTHLFIAEVCVAYI